jgi:hypothetical protein
MADELMLHSQSFLLKKHTLQNLNFFSLTRNWWLAKVDLQIAQSTSLTHLLLVLSTADQTANIFGSSLACRIGRLVV